MVYAQNLSCETLRKGVFIAAAVFVVATMILNMYYYMYFTKATTTKVAHKANRASSTVGMTGYAQNIKFYMVILYTCLMPSLIVIRYFTEHCAFLVKDGAVMGASFTEGKVQKYVMSRTAFSAS